MVRSKKDAAELLETLAERQRTWTEQFGREYSKDVITALKMGAQELREASAKETEPNDKDIS